MPKSKFKVIWSDQAVRQVTTVVSYLKSHWSNKEIKAFWNAIEAFEILCVKFPMLYPESTEYKGYRKAVLLHHISIIYHPINNTIFIVTVFDNRQDPKKIII